MSGHQGWLEKPYQEAAELSEADARARELGYEDAEDWIQDMNDRADEARLDRMREAEEDGEVDR